MALEKHSGQQLTFKTNRGKLCTIREQNGDDDDTLTKYGDGTANVLKNLRAFAQEVIMDYDGHGPVMVEQLSNMPSSERNHILLKSRIFSIGDSIEFKHTCSNPQCKKETTYEEDLNQFDWDFQQPYPKEGNEKRVKVIPHGHDTLEFDISSGKTIRMKLLTGVAEDMSLEIPLAELSRNKELTMREIELKDVNGTFQKVTVFNVFSRNDMREIREHLKENDPSFNVTSEVTCPTCGNQEELPLLINPSFFFPAGT